MVRCQPRESLIAHDHNMASFNTLCIDLQLAIDLLEPFKLQLCDEARQVIERIWIEQAERGLCCLPPEPIESHT